MCNAWKGPKLKIKNLKKKLKDIFGAHQVQYGTLICHQNVRARRQDHFLKRGL